MEKLSKPINLKIVYGAVTLFVIILVLLYAFRTQLVPGSESSFESFANYFSGIVLPILSVVTVVVAYKAMQLQQKNFNDQIKIIKLEKLRSEINEYFDEFKRTAQRPLFLRHEDENIVWITLEKLSDRHYLISFPKDKKYIQEIQNINSKPISELNELEKATKKQLTKIVFQITHLCYRLHNYFRQLDHRLDTSPFRQIIMDYLRDLKELKIISDAQYDEMNLITDYERIDK